MTIAFIGPNSHEESHRVRGAGFYAENLIRALGKYYPQNNYIITSSKKIPRSDIAHFLYFEPFFRTLPFFNITKTVVTVHDLAPLVFPENFPSGFKGKIKWNLQKLSLKRASVIITDSESSKRDIIKFTGIDDKKISVVYLAAGESFKSISNQSEVYSLIKKFKLPDKFILYVGDATWNKNLVRLLEAVKKVDIPLVMVGKALLNKNIDKTNVWNRDLVRVQELAKNNKNTIRLGFVSEDELVALYNKAAVFVMPSLYEGFGLPILEAMACACPVITARKGSIPEIAGNAAVFVDPYSVDSIAEGIIKVFSDTKLQVKLSKMGLEQANKFSWKKTAGETEDVYESVLC